MRKTKKSNKYLIEEVRDAVILLTLLKEHFQTIVDAKLFVLATKSHFDGLCHIIKDLLTTDKITAYESQFLTLIIMNGTKHRYTGDKSYIYKPGSIKPRLRLLDKLIKAYSK